MEVATLRYVQCSKCKEKLGPQQQPGFFYVEDEGKRKVAECECHKKWVENSRVLINADKNKIWVSQSSQNYNLDSYKGSNSKKEVAKIKRYITEYPYKNELHELCLYFHGVERTQKTTVAQYIGLSLFKSGYKACYTTQQLFNSIVCKPFTTEDEREDIKRTLARYDDSDLLIIDGAFDKTQSRVYDSDSQSPYIEGYLRNRIVNNKKGVLFISKVPPSEIKVNGYSASLQKFILNSTTRVNTALEFKDVIDDFEINDIFKD